MSGTGKTITLVELTGEARIDGIIQGTAWADATVYYSTPASGDEYGEDYGAGEQDGAFQISAAMRRVFDFSLAKTGGAADGFSVEGFTRLGIAFTTEAGAHIRLAQTTLDPYSIGSAWSYFPNLRDIGGDVWYCTHYRDYSAPVIGDYATLTLIHEIGHALGLSHGHERTGLSGVLPAAYDSMEYSVMTYRAYVGADVTSGYANETYGYAQSWMMLDIAALQHLYGADYSTNSGDTVYSWHPGSGITWVNGQAAITPGANRIFATLWDGGGIDTYDLSAYGSDLEIDLAPGGYSVFRPRQLVDLGRGHDARGNIFNALLHDGDPRSLIENAIGGHGRDTIRGNGAGNALNGELGADRLFGRAGDDWLRGGDGNDRLFGGAGRDRLSGSGGNDILRGGDGNDLLRAGVGDDVLLGGAGRDILRGQRGADVFRFLSADDSAPFARADHIRDFTSGTDLIDLSALVPGSLALRINGAFTGDGPSAITLQRQDDILLRADLDGDGRADFGIVLDGLDQIAATDFLL